MASWIGRKIEDIETPAMLVNRKTFEDNCKRMLETAKSMGNDEKIIQCAT